MSHSTAAAPKNTTTSATTLRRGPPNATRLGKKVPITATPSPHLASLAGPAAPPAGATN